MQQPAIPLKVVYKIVQVLPDGTMWSANPPKERAKIDARSVQYKMKHQVFPTIESPALFAVPTLQEAKKAEPFYTGTTKPTLILRCLASNVRQIGNCGFFMDSKIGMIYGLPLHFDSVLCDWLIPTSIVRIKT